MAQDTERNYPGDFLKWICNRDFCLDILTTKAATADILYPGGLLMDSTGAINVANGSEASVYAIYLGPQITVAGGEKILALVRGPAIVDYDMLNFEASVTWAECAAALAALDILPAQSAVAEWLTGS